MFIEYSFAIQPPLDRGAATECRPYNAGDSSGYNVNNVRKGSFDSLRPVHLPVEVRRLNAANQLSMILTLGPLSGAGLYFGNTKRLPSVDTS